MDEETARRAIRHLLAAGGTDVVTLDGCMYRLTAERLRDDAPEAAREFLEGRTNDQQ